MSSITKLSDAMCMLDDIYILNFHKINLLAMASDGWELGDPVRVTDLIRMYKGASSATTHKAINELIKAKLFKAVANKEDKREKVLEKGTKFDTMEDDLKGWL
jgi:hypothetical protein